MNSFLVDQNFNEHIVDGLTRPDPIMEFTHVRDVGLASALIRRSLNGRRATVSCC